MTTSCADVEAHPTADAGTPLTVRTSPVTQVDELAISRRFSGTVRSRRDSRLGFERGGLVARVHVDDGDRVERGDVVAQLDTSKLVVEKRRLSAQLAEVDANIGIASLTSRRLNKLAEKGYASAQSGDEARFGLRATTARRQQLVAAIASIDVDLRKSRLLAPFTGTVAARLVDEGTVTAAGAPIVRFLDATRPEVVVGVPATLKSELAIGNEYPLEIDGQSHRAKVVAHVRDLNPATRTTGVILELLDDAKVLDGQIARVSVQRRLRERGFWLARTSLTEGLRGLWSAYAVVEREDGEYVERRELEVLHTDGERVFVRGTLVDGDRVVASGLHRVVPGQRVETVTR